MNGEQFFATLYLILLPPHFRLFRQHLFFSTARVVTGGWRSRVKRIGSWEKSRVNHLESTWGSLCSAPALRRLGMWHPQLCWECEFPLCQAGLEKPTTLFKEMAVSQGPIIGSQCLPISISCFLSLIPFLWKNDKYVPLWKKSFFHTCWKGREHTYNHTMRKVYSWCGFQEICALNWVWLCKLFVLLLSVKQEEAASQIQSEWKLWPNVEGNAQLEFSG